MSKKAFPQKGYKSFDDYPIRPAKLDEIIYTPQGTQFMLWAPTADAVSLSIYETGSGDTLLDTIPMKLGKDGTWIATALGNQLGMFYTFNVRIREKWLGENPGINAKAVGVNGRRAAIIDWKETDPTEWEKDIRPPFHTEADMVIYEMHHRDFSIHSASGIHHKGKFLAITERNTKIPGSEISTGIDHLVELGVTHVHILPSFDFASIDESSEKEAYNWGYDPLNYNVPEGSYSTDPYNPVIRIKEFKQMVQAFHASGIRVILDVVYNHTHTLKDSPFELTVPGYFYRQYSDGTYADGTGCGNETASDRPMMRKYMIESVIHWINEYHIDGFRFDLMGIHDIGTMNLIRQAVDKIDPSICIYGEGWAAKTPHYPLDQLAMKSNMSRMPRIAAFSDEFRDALRGPFLHDKRGGFLMGIPGKEESVKFGLVGGIYHPQIDYSEVNYTEAPWADQPTQMISYTSCHDDLCLIDRLKSSSKSSLSEEEIIRLVKLGQTAVFTSQGIPFIYAGEEIFRDKKGVHNSYKSPDSINAIDWDRKITHYDVFEYYRNLISLRKNHPAFRIGDADMVREQMEFLPVSNHNVIAFILRDHANDDSWKDIIVILNGQRKKAKVNIPDGKYIVICADGKIQEDGLNIIKGSEVLVSSQTAMIIHN